MSILLSSAALAAAALAAAPSVSERIVVSAIASRVDAAIDSTPATVSVIEREELERTLAHDIREALRYEPGVSVENGAARFGLGNIAIRGLDGNRVQMLQDGVRLPEGFRVGSFSNASRNPFDVALASRIEILRGPGSALYGSDALAGVVSVTTLDPRDVLRGPARLGGMGDAGYASADDSAHGSAALAARAGPFEILLAGARAEGHERESHGELDTLGAARTVANPQDARTDSQLAKVVLPTADGGRWRLTWDAYERRVATDVKSLNPQSPRTVSLSGDDVGERRRASVDAVLHAVGFVDRLALLAYDQRSRTRQDTFEVRANTSAACLSAPGNVTCRRDVRFDFEQDEVGATVIAQSAAGESHRLVYGAEWSRTRTEEMRDGLQVNLATGAATNVVGTDVFPTRDFPNSRTERFGAFVQDEWSLAAATLVPALRYDRFDMQPQPDAVYLGSNPTRPPVGLADSAWSPKLGALVPLAEGLTLALQAATGFRAPPAFDVNVGIASLPQGYAVIPNPDLESETSRGFEAGLRGRHGGIDWSATAYLTDYRDLIVSRAPLACPGDPGCVPGAPITFQSQNVTRARIRGVEARAEAKLTKEWTARFGAAASRGDDRTKGVPLNSVEPPKVVAGLAWLATPGSLPAPAKAGVPSLGAQLHVTYAAAKKRIDDSAATFFATPSYTVVDFTGHVALGRHFTLTAGVFNLFDRKYWLWSDVRGIPNPGTSIDRYTQPGRNYALHLKAAF
jgi:hemoglobin/transferrin/lactoferrin receptor protein